MPLEEGSSLVDIINLFAAVILDSPTNRQHMMQISGASFR